MPRFIALSVFSLLLVVGTRTPAQAPPPTGWESILGPRLENGTIILGQPCSHPYVVVIPASDPILLDRLQAYVPFAFAATSQLGPYLYAGSSSQRSPAEWLSRQLRDRGFDTRVAFRPLACQP